ncbi:uncharacterized protein K02A2.6-like [Planococcus citri]|uniref:uncharacterized protein K02A2.6-like n=1 Tax=Planococcus citri TaxID=170843 RepID=UPI0031F85E7B
MGSLYPISVLIKGPGTNTILVYEVSKDDVCRDPTQKGYDFSATLPREEDEEEKAGCSSFCQWFATLLASLASPKAVESLKYTELIELLDGYLAPARNVLVAQHQFLSKYQNENQSISEYVASLRISISDIFLRAQFIRGLRDNYIREQLLQSSEEAFDSTIKKAIALEASKNDSKQISTNGPAPKPENAKLKCDLCNKTGHVSKVCITSLLRKHRSNNHTSVKNIQSQFEFDSHTYHIEEVYKCKDGGEDDRYFIYVNIENNPVMIEVDSGCRYTLIPRQLYNELNINRDLEPTTVTLRAYTSDVFKPDGKVTVSASYNGNTMQEDIYVVPDQYAPVLGRNWIRGLKIKLEEIDEKNSLDITPDSINNVSSNDIVDQFKDLFESKVGCVPDYKVHHQLREGAKPVYHKERPLPYALSELVEKELNDLEAAGIITKTETSDWGSPLVVILKADGNVRLCVDYKISVNKVLKDAHFPINKIDKTLHKLRNAKYFCRLDLFKAYLHLMVDDESSEIQTITTPFGTFKVNRLSFGIKTAPAEFNRFLHRILKKLRNVIWYFDDIVVYGATLEECRAALIEVLKELQKFNLHLNASKCVFFAESIEYLGHIVEFNKIKKSPSKVTAITQMPIPNGEEEVRRFVGMVTHYSRFIPNHSTLTAPLRKLLNEKTPFIWDNDAQIAFECLKQEIASDRVLTPFDPSLPVRLACDASPVGIAGILSHIIDGKEHPIAYGSRALTSAEKNYSQLDREALAIVFAVKHFFQYLFGRKFQLISDNRPLTRIFHQDASLPEMTSARLQRYAAFLSSFNYEIIHKKGDENVHVDCLSRAPVPIAPNYIPDSIGEEVHQILLTSVHQISSNTLTYDGIKSESANDNEIQQIIRNLQSTSDADSLFTIDDGVAYRGHRIVIPESLRQIALNELHHTHIGVTKMKQLARKYLYWKNIDKDIERMVRDCEKCAAAQKSPAKAPLHPWDEPSSNWQRIHIDYAGPFQGYHFLVVVDAKSKWMEVGCQRNAPSSESTIDMLNQIFARTGFPEIIVSDNATIFTSEKFSNYCKNRSISQKFIAPGHPATNGLAERNIQTLKKRLSSADESQPMNEKLQQILMRYRATPLKNGKSPAELYLNRKLRIQLDAIFPVKPEPNIKSNFKGTSHFQPGDHVQARYYSNNKPQWRPGEIVQKMGNLHYLVEFDTGYKIKRHINQLRQGSRKVAFADESVPEVVEPHRTRKPQLTPLRGILSSNTSDTDAVPAQSSQNQQGRRPPPVMRQLSSRERKRPRYLDDYVQ